MVFGIQQMGSFGPPGGWDTLSFWLKEVRSPGGAEIMVRWSTLDMGDIPFEHKTGHRGC